MSALWVLNPLYSFDEDAPCISSKDPRAVQLADWQRTMKQNSVPPLVQWDPKEECLPSLRPDYLFSKAIYGATIDLDFEDEAEGDWWNIIDKLTAYTTVISQGIFGIIFEGVTRATILFFLASMSALVGSMRHLLTDVIAIGLPILLVLRCLPFGGIEKMANTLLSVFVPLLFVPFFSALIITATAITLLFSSGQFDTTRLAFESAITAKQTNGMIYLTYSIYNTGTTDIVSIQVDADCCSTSPDDPPNHKFPIFPRNDTGQISTMLQLHGTILNYGDAFLVTFQVEDNLGNTKTSIEPVRIG